MSLLTHNREFKPYVLLIRIKPSSSSNYVPHLTVSQLFLKRIIKSKYRQGRKVSSQYEKKYITHRNIN